MRPKNRSLTPVEKNFRSSYTCITVFLSFGIQGHSIVLGINKPMKWLPKFWSMFLYHCETYQNFYEIIIALKGDVLISVGPNRCGKFAFGKRRYKI